MGVPIDLTKNDIPSFPQMPKGNYPIRIEEVTPPEDEKGHLKIQMVIIDGKYKGRKLWIRSSLVSKESRDFLKLTILHFGQPLKGDMDDIADSLEGCENIVAVTGHSEYNNQMYEQVNIPFNSPARDEVKEKVPA